MGILTIIAVLLVGMVPVSAAPLPYSNPTTITVPVRGAASPYPSTIVVSDFVDTVTDVNVTLYDINHTWPSDLDILLIGPGGESVILMSDVGGTADVSNLTLALDDAAASSIPYALPSGTYKPTNVDGGYDDIFSDLAPSGPYGTTLSVFNDIDPNGTWSLYVYDDCCFAAGSIAGGWSLEFNATPIGTNEPPTVTVPADITVGNDAGESGAIVNYTATASDPEDGDLTPGCTPVSGSFFEIGTTTVECTATDSENESDSKSFTVTVNDVDAPAVTVPDDITVNATSPKGAVVTFEATATDNASKTTVVCSPPSGSTFAVGTTTVTCTATDDADNQFSDSFTVTVIGAEELLQDLRSLTIDLVNNSSAEKALVATVDQLIQAEAKGDLKSFLAAMIKFNFQLKGYVKTGMISASVAHQLAAQLRQAQDSTF